MATEDFAAVLKRVRERNRLGVAALARKADVHRHTLRRWEMHEGAPQLDVAKRLVAAIAEFDPAGARELAAASKLRITITEPAPKKIVTEESVLRVLWAAASAANVSPSAIEAGLVAMFDEMSARQVDAASLEAAVRGAAKKKS